MTGVVPSVGALASLDVREVWPPEAQVFTPWLLENVNVLGEVLGTDLKPAGGPR